MLQGWVKFPIGGTQSTSRKAESICSIPTVKVRMKEDSAHNVRAVFRVKSKYTLWPLAAGCFFEPQHCKILFCEVLFNDNKKRNSGHAGEESNPTTCNNGRLGRR